MLNTNLKFNIKSTISFQDNLSSRIAGHDRQVWAYKKKINEHLYIFTSLH